MGGVAGGGLIRAGTPNEWLQGHQCPRCAHSAWSPTQDSPPLASWAPPTPSSCPSCRPATFPSPTLWRLRHGQSSVLHPVPMAFIDLPEPSGPIRPFSRSPRPGPHPETYPPWLDLWPKLWTPAPPWGGERGGEAGKREKAAKTLALNVHTTCKGTDSVSGQCTPSNPPSTHMPFHTHALPHTAPPTDTPFHTHPLPQT